MRGFITILLAGVFLLSGMHITVATHYCGGNVAGVKMSLSGMKASCGMEPAEAELPSKAGLIKTNCCYDDLRVYKTESHFSHTVNGFKALSQNTFVHAGMPVELFPPVYSSSQPEYTDLSPPGYFSVSSVRMDKICNFRI